MVEQPDFFSLPEEERQLVLSLREHNLRVAGEDNNFQAFSRFKKAAFPDKPELRKLFEFETTNGRIWYIQKIMPGEEQFVMKTVNKGTHVDVWTDNVVVRLAI